MLRPGRLRRIADVLYAGPCAGRATGDRLSEARRLSKPVRDHPDQRGRAVHRAKALAPRPEVAGAGLVDSAETRARIAERRQPRENGHHALGAGRRRDRRQAAQARRATCAGGSRRLSTALDRATRSAVLYRVFGRFLETAGRRAQGRRPRRPGGGRLSRGAGSSATARGRASASAQASARPGRRSASTSATCAIDVARPRRGATHLWK